ncbi:hypothetical protein AALP_AA2G149200 [Arabis alpina]|uniref:MRN complex-interacting protein N-terminal domain-containing protein n=1 Tax=Arabis alpina TaxID=50452 RepID=A0A087HHJ5_ARAAL|nr:hypothetical protein AALP_AA2G149200 [Arabis alpina]
MSNIVFVALQCCDCLTMQVKQRKKSSNKWVCVICNQKQSVKKVFAQGYKAKELRFFVQEFNMARKVADEKEQSIVDSFSEVDFDGGIDEDVCGKKKRSDWSEYLDSDSVNVEEDCEEGNDVKIVTEMPRAMFKKPKLNRYGNASGSSSVTGGGGKKDGDELFKPSFSSRRSAKEPDFRSDGVMVRKKDTEQKYLESERVTKPVSKWDAFLIDDEGENRAPPRFGQSEFLQNDAVERVTKPASKWDVFLIDDEGGNRAPSRFGQREVLKDDDVGEWDKTIMEINSEYQIVDEEVHPDFM